MDLRGLPLMIEKLTHKELVEKVSEWLGKTTILYEKDSCKSRCTFYVCEIVTTISHETPDILGWDRTNSILVECKTSHIDFLADRKKFYRRKDMQEYALGKLRYIAAPKGLILPDEIYPKWGMIEVDGDKISVVKRAEPFERRSKELEIGILLSVIKRNKIMSGKVKPFKKLKSLVKEKSDESY